MSAKTTSATHRYDVIAPGPMAGVVVGVAIALCLAGLATLLLRTDQGTPATQGVWLALPVVVLVAALLYQVVRRRSVALEADVLVIRAGINTHRVSASALELERARIVDLEERTELKPSLRTFGSSLPGYQTGWFRTHKWGKGFYLLTDRRRVLWLPERNGRHLLLSLQQPQALLSALNAMAHRSRAR